MTAPATSPAISALVPLYEEAGVVPELCRRLTASLERTGLPWEIVLVDDGSRDATWAAVCDARRADARIRGLRLARNFGHQAALSAALDAARGDLVVMLDGDLEDPPELIPDLVARAAEGFDVVYAVKRSRHDTALRRLGFRSFHALLHRLAPVSPPEGAGNYALVSRRVADVLRAMPERGRYFSGLRSWVGFPQTGVLFDRDPRWDGRPRMGFGRLVRLAGDALFGFSRVPLRFAFLLGLLVSLTSLGVGCWVLYQRLFTDNAISGWASTLVSIHFTGGVILLTLAVIGEYIGRIYDEVQRRPLYVVQEALGSTPPEDAA